MTLKWIRKVSKYKSLGSTILRTSKIFRKDFYQFFSIDVFRSLSVTETKRSKSRIPKIGRSRYFLSLIGEKYWNLFDKFELIKNVSQKRCDFLSLYMIWREIFVLPSSWAAVWRKSLNKWSCGAGFRSCCKSSSCFFHFFIRLALLTLMLNLRRSIIWNCSKCGCIK